MNPNHQLGLLKKKKNRKELSKKIIKENKNNEDTFLLGLRLAAGICSVTENSVCLPISWARKFASRTIAFALTTSTFKFAKL